MRKFPTDATALLTDDTETRPSIQTELNVETYNSEPLISGLVDCVATLNFVV
jgi:hypothetical protein